MQYVSILQWTGAPAQLRYRIEEAHKCDMIHREILHTARSLSSDADYRYSLYDAADKAHQAYKDATLRLYRTIDPKYRPGLASAEYAQDLERVDRFLDHLAYRAMMKRHPNTF